MEVAIVVWLLLAIVTAVVASKKGRSVVGWFFIGAILGIFGLVWVLLASSKEEEKALASGQTKVCPYCAEHIRAEANTCRFCGKDL